MSEPTLFLIYDDRASGGDTSEAIVHETARTLKEARREGPKHGRVAIYGYDTNDDGELTNERFIESIG